jgi:hypothetical protein
VVATPGEGADALPLAARDAVAGLLLEHLARSESEAAPLADAAALLDLEDGAQGACATEAARALAHAGIVALVPGGPPGRATVRRVAAAWDGEVRDRLRRYASVLARVPRGSDLATRRAQADAMLRAGLFFEVHEVLEPAWRRAAGAERLVLQGVIQAAVAWHHWQRGNARAAARLASAACAKLEGPLPEWPELALGEVRDHAARWAAWLAAGSQGDAPPLPR